MIVYLASPYSHVNPLIRESRFRQACAAAAKLMLDGEVVFAPIAHSHPIDTHFAAPGDFDFWMEQDLPILRKCDALKVLRLTGWEQSRGVAREIQEARAIGLPIEFIDP